MAADHTPYVDRETTHTLIAKALTAAALMKGAIMWSHYSIASLHYP